MNWIQWVGAILLIGGVIIVSSKNTKFAFDRGEIYAILAALLFAFANINDVFLLKHFDPYSYVVFGFLFPGLLLCVIYPKKISLIRPYFSKELFYKIIFLSIIYGINAIAFFAALQIVPNVSQLFTMNSISVVVTVILAIIFLKENNSLIRKLFGSCLSVIGLILVK
ncbi:EamA family transporter [bacterium]|nr:EamA family transporter [bacterium]